MTKLKKFVILKSLYFAFAQSHIDYRIIIWDAAMNSTTKKIPQILKKAERTILFNSYHAQSESLFKELNILSFYKQKFRTNEHLSNKGIKQTINSRRIVLIGYWRTMQCIMTWLQQRRTVCNAWTKTSHLQTKIGVVIFASFR